MRWEQAPIIEPTDKWKQAPLVPPKGVRPLQRKLGAFRGAGATGVWEEAPKVSLFKRFGRRVYNIGPEMVRGALSQAKKFAPGEVENIRKAQAEILAGKLGPEEAERMRESLKRGERRVKKLAPLPVPPPETWKETGVDLGVGLGSFLLQIVALKKGMPKGTSTSAVWEMQNLLSGGTPGMGAASYAAFSAPGKIIKGVKLPSKAGRLVAESAALMSISALEQKIDTGEIDPVQIGIAAALPVALRTPGAIKKLIKARHPKVIKAIAEQPGIDPMVAAMDIDKPVR